MNQVIEIMKNHRSIRTYLDKEVSEDIINELIHVAQAAPSSINGQQTSVIVVIELLNLPEYTYPLVGLALGYPADNSKLKPRMPVDAYRHDEEYNKEILPGIIDKYDEEMEVYLKEIGREVEGNWSSLTSNIYQSVYYPEVYPSLKKQGFKNEK